MNNFFRFPHTSHIDWLGEGSPRDDKVLAPDEVSTLLANDVVVEEKLDGANIGFSLGANGQLQVQNRGQYLVEPYAGQFSRLTAWLALHGAGINSVIKPNLILFGEWCAARHSLNYSALPDWFLLFDVYDTRCGRFWSSARRNTLAQLAGLATVPQLQQGKTTLSALKQLIATQPSRYQQGPLEGVVIRQDSDDWCERRAKLVRADFTQTIETHWSKRAIEWNRIGNTSQY